MGFGHCYTFFTRCFHRRKQASEFTRLLPAAIKRWNLTHTEIAACLTKSAVEFCTFDEPLLPQYVRILLNNRHIQVSDLLIACIQKWKAISETDATQTKKQMMRLSQVVASLISCLQEHDFTQQHARICLVLCGRWLEALFAGIRPGASNAKPEPPSVMTATTTACLITLLNTKSGQASLVKLEKKRDDILNCLLRRVLQSSIAAAPDLSAQLLTEAGKFPGLSDISLVAADVSQEAELATLQFESTIVQAPIVPTKAAVYYVLYSKVGGICSRPIKH